MAPIVILCPMQVEYGEIAAAMTAPETLLCGSFTGCRGTVAGKDVIAVLTLIGTVNLTAAAVLAIEKFRPSCVIVQGTAGGHNPALHRGDIVLGQDIVPLTNYISPRRAEGEGVHPMDWICPGVQTPQDGQPGVVRVFHSDEALLRAAASVPYTHGNVVRGVIGSGDVWNREYDFIVRCREKLGTDCEEMESFAAAQVCAMYHLPFLAVRVISNSELHPDERFDQSAAAYCQQFCLDLIHALDDRA